MNATSRVERYTKAVQLELQRRILRPPIWEKALSQANGDEALAKDFYLKTRVEQLKEDEAIRIESELEREKREKYYDNQVARSRMVERIVGWIIFIGTMLWFMSRLR